LRLPTQRKDFGDPEESPYMSVRELRLEVLKECDVLQAILAFNYSLTKKHKSDLDEIRALAPTSPAKRLRDIRDQLRANIKRMTRELGCLVDPNSFAATFIRGCLGGIPNFSKAAIDSTLFSNFCGGNPTWKAFPPHLRLQAHINWTVSELCIFHFELPEAMLYEDMPLAYNLAHDTRTQASQASGPGGNIDVKKHYLHLRTALLSAFYFVEAYLNGIAYDYWYKKRTSLSTNDQDLLLEWDSQRHRRSLVSFEKKINEYPKIILNCQHPPLTVTNSKSLNLLLGDGKEMRDSVVHQSSKTLDISKVPDKVKWMQSIRFEPVTQVVDAAVGFVKEMNGLLGNDGLLLDWMYLRDPQAGTFPPEAFQ
jgi:hypothetical protein